MASSYGSDLDLVNGRSRSQIGERMRRAEGPQPMTRFEKRPDPVKMATPPATFTVAASVPAAAIPAGKGLALRCERSLDEAYEGVIDNSHVSLNS